MKVVPSPHLLEPWVHLRLASGLGQETRHPEQVRVRWQMGIRHTARYGNRTLPCWMSRLEPSNLRNAHVRFQGGCAMITRKLRCMITACVAFAKFATTGKVAALSPRGRHVEGVFIRVDTNASRASIRANDGKLLTFRWTWKTRFASDVRPQRGDRASVVYQQPFFGEPFVTRVTVSASPPGPRVKIQP